MDFLPLTADSCVNKLKIFVHMLKDENKFSPILHPHFPHTGTAKALLNYKT